jgi:hypothetical protein
MRDIVSRLELHPDEFNRSTIYEHVAERTGTTRLVPFLRRTMEVGRTTYYADSTSVLPSFKCWAVHCGPTYLQLTGVIVLVGENRFVHRWEWYETSSNYLLGGYESYAFGDNDLARSIAEAPDSIAVKVRLCGSASNRDFEMSSCDRQIWREMWYYFTHFEYRDRQFELQRMMRN